MVHQLRLHFVTSNTKFYCLTSRDPTPETTDLLPVKWVPATKDRWNYLNIDSEVTMESRPFNDRMAFLDLFYKMNEKFQKGIDQN